MTTTDSQITINDQTVSAAGNLFQLDALVQGYGEILEQAKRQLEAFEPTDEQFSKIARSVSQTIDYNQLGYVVASSIVDEDRYPDIHVYTDRLVRRIEGRIDERKIRGLIREELDSVVNSRFEALKNDVARQIAVILDEDRRAANRANAELQAAVRTIFSTVLKDELRNEVRSEMHRIDTQRSADTNS
jgi:hypothetical protein